MHRNGLAAALFAMGSATFLWFASSWFSCGSGCVVRSALFSAPLLGLAGLHAALAFGVLRDRPWARWMGIGVGFAWVLSTALIACSNPAIWMFGALHAPLPLLLARPDGVHSRTAMSLLLTGMALPLALTLGLGELALMSVSWTVLLGTGLAVVGAAGLARQRTWGLLMLGVAGLTYLCSGLVEPMAMHRPTFGVTGLVALPLLAALVPFARPIAGFLERD